MPDTSTELQSKLLVVLDYIGERAKEGADFAAAQLPLVANDVIRWGIWSHFIMAGVILFGMIVLALFGRYALKQHAYCTIASNDRAHKDHNRYYRYDGDLKPVYCITFVIMGLLFIPLCVNIYGGLKPLIAPRVYLIEWVSEQAVNLKR